MLKPLFGTENSERVLMFLLTRNEDMQEKSLNFLTQTFMESSDSWKNWKLEECWSVVQPDGHASISLIRATPS